MRMKKMLAVLLCLFMLATVFAACGDSSTPSTTGDGDTTPADETGDAGDNGDSGDAGSSGDKVELTALFISHSLTKSVNDMQWLAEVEEAAGVNVSWEQIYQDWEQVKSTRFAAGDIPDIMFNATNVRDYPLYPGLFADLTDLIDQYAPNIQRMFEEEPDTKTLATSLDGAIYSTPKYQGKWPETNTVLFINQDWLDNLSLDMPTTFTEFEAVLNAFVNDDPNGNGAADEIGIDFNAYGGNNAWFNSAYSLTRLLGSMGIQLVQQANDSYFVEDYEVKSYAVDERYKLFIEYLARLNSQGLINSNAITNDYSAFQSLSRGNEAGEAVVGAVFGWEETDKFGPELYTQYTALPPLEYDIDVPAGTYDTLWAYDYDTLNMDANRAVISGACENKEAAIRFIDGFYDPEVSVQVLFGGISDGNVEKISDTSFKVLDPLDPDTDPGTWKWTSTFADNGPMYIPRAVEIDMQEDMDNALREREVYADALAKLQDSTYYPQMFMKYTEEDESQMALTQANINNIIDNYWALWITGESDVNADWDSYVAAVEGAGLAEVLEIRQGAYDVYRGN